jgi:hypothetical protein
MKKTIENLQPNIRHLLDRLERESEGATREQLQDIVRKIGMVNEVQSALEKALAVGPPRITQDHFYIEDVTGFPWDTAKELGLLDDEK